jgi:uncharacterized cupredoxin-like copper-binding protein
MTRPTTFALATVGAALLLASPALAAGDGHDHDHGMSGDMARMHDEMEARMADTAAFGMKGDPAKVSRMVKIEASEIRFDIEALQVGRGETIRFVVTNKGEQPHELSIGDEAYHGVARQMMAHLAEMGMDPASDQHAAVHAAAGNTAIVPAGETREVVWAFTQPGSFEFSCNFVGHSEVGMKGRITVN